MDQKLKRRIDKIVRLIGTADDGEILRRAFFQLNNDLASADIAALRQAGNPCLPADRSRAALVAAAFAFRYHSLDAESPAWLRSPSVRATNPVFLTSGLEDLVRTRTPGVVRHHNVYVDAASFPNA